MNFQSKKEYMFLLGGNIMPGTDKLRGELLFPGEIMVVEAQGLKIPEVALAIFKSNVS